MSHSHDHHSHHHRQEKNLLFTLFLNLIITGAQAAGGILSGSLALLSDALHNLSDGAASFISLMAVRLSKKETSPEKTFGWRRAEILAALLNTVILTVMVILIFKEAIERLLEPSRTLNPFWIMILGGVGLLANALSALILKKDAQDSLNIRSAYLHLLTDALASLAVVTGGAVMALFGWFWLDPVLSLLLGIFVLKESAGILKESVEILMGFTPKEVNLDALCRRVETLEGVANLHHVHVWKLSDHEIHFEAHLDLNQDWPLSRVDALRMGIEELLRCEFGIAHVTLQCEYQCCGDTGRIKKIAGDC